MTTNFFDGNLTLDSSNNRIGIGTTTPTTRFDVNGNLKFTGASMGGHILPTSNADYDIGSAEYKVRHLFLSDNSLWIGDTHKISISGDKMKFRKRKTTSVPAAVTDAGGNEAGAKTHAGVGSLADMTLHHWEAYMKTLDGQSGKSIEDVFRKNFTEDYDEDIGSIIWTESGDNIYRTTGNVGIGTASPSQKLEVAGSIKITGGNPATGKVLTCTSANDGTAEWTTVSGGSSSLGGLSDVLIEDNSIYIGNDPASTTNNAQYNVAIGATALDAITTGDKNVAIGYDALTANNTGEQNTAIGYNALKSAFQSGTPPSGAVPSVNTAIGSFSLQALTTGSSNVAVGQTSGYNLTTGEKNTLLGVQAGVDIVDGDHNVCVGADTGKLATSANYNTLVGSASGDVITTGSDNVCVGHLSDPSAQDGTNQIVIGKGATGVANNSVTLGNASVTAVYMASDSGATVHCGGLQIGGAAVSSTAAELNIMDGGTGATSTTLVDADRVVVNDNGTMKQVALTDFETYFESALDTLSNVTTVGTLGSLTVTNQTQTGTVKITGGSPATGKVLTCTSANDGTAEWATPSGGGGSSLWSEGSSSAIYYNSANVGIGTASPSYKLHIAGETYATKFFASTTTSGGSTNTPQTGTLGGTGDRIILWPGDGSNYPYSIGINGGTLWHGVPSAAIHSWYIGNSEKMRLSADGNLGIGTASPTIGKLQVTNASGTCVRLDSATGQTAVSIGGVGRFNIDAVGVAAGRFTVLDSGNVGVGTASPNTKLHIYGGASGYQAGYYTPQIRIEDDVKAGIYINTPTNDTHFAFWAHATPFDGETTSMRSYGASRYLGWQVVNGNQRMTLTTTTLDVPGTSVSFTGGHKTNIVKENSTTTDEDLIGLICVSNGEYIPNGDTTRSGVITINNSWPKVVLSSIPNQKNVFGVYNKNHLSDEKFYDSVNSIGEGGIWICDENQNLENGDYITTSSVKGYGMRQTDDCLHNYTVAKITTDCDFSKANDILNRKQYSTYTSDTEGEMCNLDANNNRILIDKTDDDGNIIQYERFTTRYLLADGTQITQSEYDTKLANNETVYKAAFVGCTYHCG